MKKYLTPEIEREELETNDVILVSPEPTQPPTGEDEGDWVSMGGSIGGSTGKITIGGTTTGGFSAGDLFGNR